MKYYKRLREKVSGERALKRERKQALMSKKYDRKSESISIGYDKLNNFLGNTIFK